MAHSLHFGTPKTPNGECKQSDEGKETVGVRAYVLM
jgi:hypothetical protein